MDFDEILEDLGDFGKYQQIIIYVVLLPAVIPCGFHAYNQIFMSAEPDHWCRVPELESRNISLEVIKNLSVPLEIFNGVEKYKECFYYNRTYLGNQSSVEEIPCQDGWKYDTSKYTSTIVSEWDLVCDHDFYPTFALILFGVGGCVGNYIFGYIQDSLGRKTAFFMYLLIESFFGIASAFANNFTVWTILRFGVGFTVPAILGSPYVLAVELVGPKNRAYITILLNIAYSMSLVLLSGVCYIFRDWRNLTLATTLPFLILFFYWWVMPESPRWLYARGEFEKCTKILKTIAEINNIDLNEEYIAELKEKFLEERKCVEKSIKSEKNYGVFDLFRYPNLRRKTILITLIWFTNTAVYVGLSYYAPALGEDEFLNFFLAGIVELPTYFFLWPAMEKLGRRWTLCSSMVVGGVACLTTFLSENRETITLILYCIGKMGISCSFVVLPLMASELYPTVVRGIGISFSSVIGQIGPIVIPIINYMGEDWMILPLLIMGSLLVVGGVLSLILPETLHQHLPETLQEAENFGNNSCCAHGNSIRAEVTNTKKTKHPVNFMGLNNRENISGKVDTKEVQTEF